MSLLCFVFGYLCLPELKGRSLEEIEVMFEDRTPPRRFGQYQFESYRVGTRVTGLERRDSGDLKNTSNVVTT